MSPATYLVPLGVALAGSLAIEAAAASRRPSLRPGDLAIRAAGYTLITLFWFQFSWRPWLAATSCLLTLAVLAVVDRLKRKVIGESVVFSDLALLAQVPRHPQLYYTLPLTDLRIAGPLLDLTRETNADVLLQLQYKVETAPAGPVRLSLGSGSVNAASLFAAGGGWKTARVPLKCFAAAGGDMAKVDVPLALSGTGPFAVAIADARLVTDPEGAVCPK